jgi:hypothetical protein
LRAPNPKLNLTEIAQLRADRGGEPEMSDSDDPTEEPPCGYRNPPIKHRFRKGVSGNRKGRPRKQRALVATKVGGELTIGLEDRIKSLVIEEAYRLVPVREGDRVKRMPAIRAILRRIVRDAANGDARAQQMFLKLVAGAEADRGAAAKELLRVAVGVQGVLGRTRDLPRASSSPRRRYH